MSADTLLQRVWYGSRWHVLSLALLPLSWLFRLIVAARRAAFRSGFLRSFAVDVPVIVVGNVTVGGTGKTPFTGWLAQTLQRAGYRVGIVLRGYGGRAEHWPCDVNAETPWQQAGDEAVLLAQRTGAIVVVAPDRVAAARRAVERGAQIVLCDDGLQHYRLRRTAEFVVVDGVRGLGNRRTLPAGPLREPPRRVGSADLLIVNQRQDGLAWPLAAPDVPCVTFRPVLHSAYRLIDGERRALSEFRNAPVHAVAAIGHPEGFFAALREQGLTVAGHALPDHAPIQPQDIQFDAQAPVLMTEKDAVKCRAFAQSHHWVVPMEIDITASDTAVVECIVQRALRASGGEAKSQAAQ